MKIERGTRWLRIELSGEIDLHWYEDHRHDIELAMQSCPALVIIDVEHVSFMDSTGLSLLAQAYRQSRQKDGQVYLLHPSSLVAHAIGITGLDSLVTVAFSCEQVRQISDRVTQLDAYHTSAQGRQPAIDTSNT